MKFGIFYEHQLPRPWAAGAEQSLYHEALDQIQLADDLGFDVAWTVEHHFLEEYSHSSAPEVFLAAAADRTDEIRLGHGIKLMPPGYNPTFRAAEQVATLDIVSDGRVEFGTGESGSRMELGGPGIDVDEKYDMWQEGVREAANMLAMEPYPGAESEHVTMPARNIVPKPVQEPHPPLWMACSSQAMIEVAARHGLGALCFAFADPDTAADWVETYYETFREECVPLGHDVNPNVAMITGFSCHEDAAEARRRGIEGFAFFRYALGHYYQFGTHTPGYTDLWSDFQAAGGAEAVLGEDADSFISGTAIGRPDQLRTTLRQYEDAGVDQVILIGQGGNNAHEHICASMELFAETVMPDFAKRDREHEREKAAQLEPAIEAAMARRDWPEAPDPSDLPAVEPYERPDDRYE
ncbi:MAG: LLM class flavin-dependent oxidoreductase [Salinirussus sp.]